MLIAIFGLLQFALAGVTFPRDLLIGAVFAVAGLLIIVGIALRRVLVVVLGAIAAIAGPLATGLTGLEPFELIHHVVRVLLLGVVLTLWFVSLRSFRRQKAEA